MLTLRKKIAEALEGESLGLREISQLFEIMGFTRRESKS
jgi:hypothetical protein